MRIPTADLPAGVDPTAPCVEVTVGDLTFRLPAAPRLSPTAERRGGDLVDGPPERSITIEIGGVAFCLPYLAAP